MVQRILFALMLVTASPALSQAGFVIYSLNENGGLAGFNAAAGSPPVSIDFDGFAPGTNLNGSTVSGVLLQPASGGAPLIVVQGADTVTPAGFDGLIDPATNQLLPTTGLNVLSPGGVTLGPGSDPAVENDGLSLTFSSPLAAFGFDHLSQSADGFSFTSIEVYDAANNLVYSGTVPISNIGNLGGGAPGGADFWGVVATDNDRIGRIVITESDSDSTFPDCNIGYDSFRFVSPGTTAVPEPASAVLLVLGGTSLLIGYRRRRTGRLAMEI